MIWFISKTRQLCLVAVAINCSVFIVISRTSSYVLMLCYKLLIHKSLDCVSYWLSCDYFCVLF